MAGLDRRKSCMIKDAQDLREVLSSANPLEKLLGIDRTSASMVVELLYTELQGPGLEDRYRRRCLRYLKAMGKQFHALPSSLFMKDIGKNGEHPLTGGGFADIYKGRAGSVNVCLKVLRVHLAENEKKRQKIIANFCQEALIWTQLRHPNILPLLGVNTELFPSNFCLVSPWMVNSDIISFLEEHPSHDRLQSISEIVSGLEYLHSLSPPIVHGDIKGANILVSEDHHCLLADFGLAAASAESMTMIHTTSGGVKGSIRWMAPELYAFTDGVSTDKNVKEDKTPCDIYAFACTVLEIMTGKPPFFGLVDAAVIYHVSVRQLRPERPTEGWCPDRIWNLVEKCWDEDPLKRPRVQNIRSYLKRLSPSDGSSVREPHFTSDHSQRGDLGDDNYDRESTPVASPLTIPSSEGGDGTVSRASSPPPPDIPSQAGNWDPKDEVHRRPKRSTLRSKAGGYVVPRTPSPPLPDIPPETENENVVSVRQSPAPTEDQDPNANLLPWQKVHQRLLNWAKIVLPSSEIEEALMSTIHDRQVNEVALSIWTMQTYKRYVRARMLETPAGVVDRFYVPPYIADAINRAVFNGRHGDACGMLRDLWGSFGLEGRPRLLLALTRHRSDDNHWVVHRFSLPDGSLTSYDTYPERTLVDGRPLGWWFAIRLAWPNYTYPSPDNLVQKMVRLHREMQSLTDNSLAAAAIWRNILLGVRWERSIDLVRLRELVNKEMRELRSRTQKVKPTLKTRDE